MEICDTSAKKSLLKKSDVSVIKKTKRVTFCSTVKVFIGELDDNKQNVDFQKNCVEVNIVDKSIDDPLVSPDGSKSDDCTATDFLVHKVVYENSIEHDDEVDTEALSEDTDESPVLFETNADDEGLHFVVHKVTDHEDDLIQQELDLDEDTSGSFSEEIECEKDLIGKLSELSIENILTHDKIIAFIDQNTLSLSSLLKSHLNSPDIAKLDHTENPIKNKSKVPVSPCLKNPDLILSPPLQELSLDKIVRAQSDNALCELDISPLNSIQETDSDSDASSEGTMIMMTTEESEKNEQHIRESFQKYESMKKSKIHFKEVAISELELDKDLRNQPAEICEKIDAFNLSSATCEECHSDHSEDFFAPDRNLKQAPETEANILNTNPVTETNTNIGSEEKSELVQNEGYFSNYSMYIPTSDKDFIVTNSQETNSGYAQDTRKVSFPPVNNVNNVCYWDKSLESIQIPKDVREWKIPSSPEKSSKCNTSDICSTADSYESQEVEYSSVKPSMQYSDLSEMQRISPKSDELESFVIASKERVQRIRKRYLEKTQKRTANSPVRGVRPRFGSTAEILQLMQKQNQPPYYAFNYRSHVSWPCNNAISNSEVSIHGRKQLNHMFSCHSLPSDCSSQSSLSSCVSVDSSGSNCDHDSVASCPSMFFHERGVPEGASPPRSLSEDSVEQYSGEENANNIVYFSMKV